MANHVDCDRQPTSGIWAWMYERVRTQTADRRRNARMLSGGRRASFAACCGPVLRTLAPILGR